MKGFRSLFVTMLCLVLFAVVAQASVSSNGNYVTMDYADLHIGSNNGMGVTISSGGVNTNRYLLDANRHQIHWMLDLIGLTTSGTTTNSFILIQIPEGKYGNVTVTNDCKVQVNGAAWENCYVITGNGFNSLYIRRQSEANWPVTNNIRLNLNQTFEYRDSQ